MRKHGKTNHSYIAVYDGVTAVTYHINSRLTVLKLCLLFTFPYYCIYIEDYIEQSKNTLFTLNSRSTAELTTAMERISNAEFTGMHLTYCAANGNIMEPVRIYRGRFANRHVRVHQTFTPIHRRLRETR